MKGKLLVFLLLVIACLGAQMRRILAMPTANIDPDF